VTLNGTPSAGQVHRTLNFIGTVGTDIIDTWTDSPIDIYLGAGGSASLSVQQAGVTKSTRQKLNFLSGATVADNSGNSSADVTITPPVQLAGTLVSSEPALNFAAGFNVVDNPGISTDVTALTTVFNAGDPVAAEPAINFAYGFATTDSAGSFVNVSWKGVEFYNNPALISIRPAINFSGNLLATDNPTQNWVDLKALTNVAVAGTTQAVEPVLNFVSGFTVTDNTGVSADVTWAGMEIDYAGSGVRVVPKLNFTSNALVTYNGGTSAVDVTPLTAVQVAGSLIATEPALNFVSGANVVNNPGVSADVTIVTPTQQAGTLIGARPALNFTYGAIVTDNPGNGTIDIAVPPATAVQIGGTPSGTEAALNFVSGASASNNPGSGRVDVTILTTVQSNGSAYGAEPALNFLSPFSVYNNAGAGSVDIGLQAPSIVYRPTTPYTAAPADRYIITYGGQITLPAAPPIGTQITISADSTSAGQVQAWVVPGGSDIIAGSSGVTFASFYPVPGTTGTSYVLSASTNPVTFTYVGSNLAGLGGAGSGWIADRVEETVGIATSAGAYTNVATDVAISCDTTAGPVAVNLSTFPIRMGQRCLVSDSLGNAATNNITITAPGPITYTINSNYGRIDFVYAWTPGGSGGASWH
jgi:hypothetical protein